MCSEAVCLIDVTLQLEKESNYEAVCAAVKKASDGSLSKVLDSLQGKSPGIRQVLGITDGVSPLASPDLLGEQRSGVVDRWQQWLQ